ncbi:hypothetical protein PN467_03350 [Microcystis aeruginosa CS-563/04]|uniref:hypothetical protein n=1 Tax=Microcystis aeruginosa TaxID=1126 RepID=UPI002330025A|nr:hypothetical protein [Microcystis aeruginosa]MDB9419584.1 hypothetical protein [Microcystis aeruginosa CS-563/04]
MNEDQCIFRILDHLFADLQGDRLTAQNGRITQQIFWGNLDLILRKVLTRYLGFSKTQVSQSILTKGTPEVKTRL